MKNARSSDCAFLPELSSGVEELSSERLCVEYEYIESKLGERPATQAGLKVGH